jgi:hypothetical protein
MGGFIWNFTGKMVRQRRQSMGKSEIIIIFLLAVLLSWLSGPPACRAEEQPPRLNLGDLLPSSQEPAETPGYYSITDKPPLSSRSRTEAPPQAQPLEETPLAQSPGQSEAPDRQQPTPQSRQQSGQETAPPTPESAPETPDSAALPESESAPETPDSAAPPAPEPDSETPDSAAPPESESEASEPAVPPDSEPATAPVLSDLSFLEGCWIRESHDCEDENRRLSRAQDCFDRQGQGMRTIRPQGLPPSIREDYGFFDSRVPLVHNDNDELILKADNDNPVCNGDG